MTETKPVFTPTGRGLGIERAVHTFGNGVEIETSVWVKASELGLEPSEYDVVKIHFLPILESGELANKPDKVPVTEKPKIKIDAMEGLIQMAKALQNASIMISDHTAGQDFYLCLNTNTSLARFMTRFAGFKGDYRYGQVWMLASQFSSPENSINMQSQLTAARKQPS